MKYKDSEKKLDHARSLFEDAVDHHETAHAEAHRAARFFHNSDCEGQWETEDLEYLRKNQRMVMTFNVLKTKINTFLGMYADAQRVPIIAASGSDTLAAEVLDAVKDQLLQDANYQSLAARVLKSGTVSGECSMHIEVVPSDDGQGWIKVNLYRVLATETLWDIASVEPDRSDARYVFWYRWLDKEEFKSEYPDHAEEWDKLRGVTGDEPSSPYFGEQDSSSLTGSYDDYSDSRTSRYYFDSKQNKIRVIRYEYKHTEDVKYALDLQTGKRIDLTDKKLKKRVDLAMSMGAPFQINETVEDRTEVCEFTGTTLLAEYEEAGPFEGFSLVPYCFDVDEETGTSYGMCRDLFDPQMELNKARSLDMELTAQATTPGTIAEEGAIPDRAAYERERRRPNGIALVSKGALSEGSPKIIERQATPPSALAAQRTTAAMELLDEVSGIPSASNLTAAEHQQAAATVAIKYHKSRQTVSTPFSHFEISQMNIVEKLAQVIVDVMPDDQIIAMLGTREDIVIQGDRIIEVESGPAGPDGQPQQVPKRMMQMPELRDIKWHLDLEYASENSTLRMLELNVLLQVATVTQMPLDPDVLIELSTASRSYRERLKKFLEQAQAASAEGAKAESQALQAQTQGMLQIEASKVQETERHNVETERLKAMELAIKAELEKTKIYADADDTEKGHMLEVVKLSAQMKMGREKKATTSGGSNG